MASYDKQIQTVNLFYEASQKELSHKKSELNNKLNQLKTKDEMLKKQNFFMKICRRITSINSN